MTTAVHLALIGKGIQASRTPAMHRAEGAALGLDLLYDLIDTGGQAEPDIGVLLARAQAAGLTGVNVTHPFKQAVLAHLDSLSNEARAIGAVNTVVFRNGSREGHNTDYRGFATAFHSGLTGADVSDVLLLGAGGAGAAVAHALLDGGVGHLAIADTRHDAADRLVQALQGRHGAARVSVAPSLAGALCRATGIVNATPMGMAAHPGSPVPQTLLEPRHWVADIVYVPLETALLAQARGKGCVVLDGAGMAVFQAVHAFDVFTGAKADPARMRAVFDRLGS